MINETLTLSIPAKSPFRLDLTVWALRRRVTNIVDRWNLGQYTRVHIFNNNPIKITVMQDGTITEPKIRVSIQSSSEITQQMQEKVQFLLQKMLGLSVELQNFYSMTSTNDILKSLVERFLGVKPPRFSSIFEGLINAMACQRLSLDVGILMLNKLSEHFGLKIIDGDDTLHAFPRPEDLVDVSEENLRNLGFSFQKAKSIKELARAVLDETIDLSNLESMTNDEIIVYLSTIRGIGRWSAEYVLLRGLGRLDTFPGDDIGAQNNLKRVFKLENKPTYEEIKRLTSQWHPYEGFIYFHLLLEKLQLKISYEHHHIHGRPFDQDY